MATTPARPMGLLYGAPNNVPSPNMDWLRAPGCCYVQNRTINSNVSWLTGARALGMEALYYTNLVEYPIGTNGGWNPAPGDEEYELYNRFGAWSNVPDAYWWTGNRATASSRTNYAGNYMLNIRPGSIWWQHVLEWAVEFWTRQNGRLDGHFLDVMGNRLWVGVWTTMANTVDAYAGDGRTEAENWIRGIHWGLTQLRAAIGPEVILVANNLYDQTGLGLAGGKTLGQITGGYPSMQKGGHPALNGCMFEGCDGGATTGQHPVSRVTADIAGGATAGSPSGHEWATQAGGRKRFMAISSKPAANMAAYVGVPTLWVGHMPNGYTSKVQSQVSGTVKVAWDDHIQGWTFDGSTPPDTTPPLAPAAFSAGPAAGSSVPLSWTLTADSDLQTFLVARKATPWGGGEVHTVSGAATVLTLTEPPAGAGSSTATNVPAGTWYFKAFTIDEAGNENTTGPQAQVSVAPTGDTTPPQAATAFAVGTPTGSSLPVTWTLPADSDRASFRIYRKATAWGASETLANGTLAYTATPGAAGAGSTTLTGLPDGTWYFKSFTVDAAANVQANGPASGAVVIAAATGPALTYKDESFVGLAGAKPDATVWTDPDPTASGLASGTLRLDGSGELRATVKAAVDATYGGVVLQSRDRISWASERPRRALLVEMGGSGAVNGSSSFYLIGPSGTESGAGLVWSSLFPYPDWLRFEHFNSTFLIRRRTQGALETLYSGAAPAGLYEVWLLIDTTTLTVEVNGVEVLSLSPWTDDFTTPFDEAFLYLEATTDDNPAGWTARFGSFRFMRATPSEPGDPTAVVSPGQTEYSSPVPPAEDLVDTWRYLIDNVEVAEGSSRTLVGAELNPGEYDLGVETENASPFVEA